MATLFLANQPQIEMGLGEGGRLFDDGGKAFGSLVQIAGSHGFGGVAKVVVADGKLRPEGNPEEERAQGRSDRCKQSPRRASRRHLAAVVRTGNRLHHQILYSRLMYATHTQETRKSSG